MDLRALRQTASHILAAALFETFPGVDLWISGATDVGFFTECFFPHPIHPDTLPLIEQKMKEIVREAREIRLLEMVPVSAAGLLKKEGHQALAESLLDLESNALIELVQMGSFHELTQGALLKNSAEVSAFKLLSIEPMDGPGIRIEGTVCFSKEELKKFLKLLTAHQEKNYKTIGRDLGFWKVFDEGIIWFKKGLEAREKIQKFFFQDAPFVECSEFSDELFTALQKNFCHFKRCNSKDLRSSPNSFQQVIFFQADEFSQTLNSSLLSISKSLIMLDFDCWIQLTGKRGFIKEVRPIEGMRIEKIEGMDARIDVMARDSLMRPVQIASFRELKVDKGKKSAFLCEAFIERILVLVLEKNLRTSFLLTEPEPR